MEKVEFNLRYYSEYKPELITRGGERVRIIAIRKSYITYLTPNKPCVANLNGTALTPGQKDRDIMMIISHE